MCISVCGLLPYPCCFMDNLENFYLSYCDVIAFLSFFFFFLILFLFLVAVCLKICLAIKCSSQSPGSRRVFISKRLQGNSRPLKVKIFCDESISHSTGVSSHQITESCSCLHSSFSPMNLFFFPLQRYKLNLSLESISYHFHHLSCIILCSMGCSYLR